MLLSRRFVFPDHHHRPLIPMEWIVLLPPILAIVLALWTKEVYLSLLAGLWLGTTILVGGNPILVCAS